jgi:hypothetical protein
MLGDKISTYELFDSMERCKVNIGDSEKHFEEMENTVVSNPDHYLTHFSIKFTKQEEGLLIREARIMQTNWMPTLQHMRFNKLPWP